MPTCIVKGCTNRSSKKTARQEVLEERINITFHTLPKDPTKRQLWLHNLKLDASSMPKQAVVCSLHFKDNDFDRTSLSRVRLRSYAVPYIQVPIDEGESSSNSSLEQETRSCTFDKSLDNEPLHKIRKLDLPPRIEHTLLETKDIAVPVDISSSDKAKCISPQKIFNSPTKIELHRYILKLKERHRHELRVLKQRCKRKTDKIASFKKLFQDLQNRNLLSAEHVQQLQGETQNHSLTAPKKEKCSSVNSGS